MDEAPKSNIPLIALSTLLIVGRFACDVEVVEADARTLEDGVQQEHRIPLLIVQPAAGATVLLPMSSIWIPPEYFRNS